MQVIKSPNLKITRKFLGNNEQLKKEIEEGKNIQGVPGLSGEREEENKGENRQ
jgi:hypothetical protein